MKHLVVPGDLICAAEKLARLRNTQCALRTRPEVAILTGCPCCVDHSPPIETDGLASGEYTYNHRCVVQFCIYSAIVYSYYHDIISPLKFPLQRHV